MRTAEQRLGASAWEARQRSPVLHGSFFRSTLLAKAQDIPGHSVGYSEPGILNDIAGHGTAAHALLPPVLALLSSPRSGAEVVFVKPRNHANGLIPALMAARPDACAIMLSSGCEAFLASIHRKGLPGRSRARRLDSSTFARDAKTGGAVPTPSASHGEIVDEEIAKVVQWIGHVAASAGIPLEQPVPLF